MLYEGALRKQDLLDIPFKGARAKANGTLVTTMPWCQHKNQQPRSAQFSKALWERLQKYREEHFPGTTSDSLFPGMTYNGLKS